MNVLFDHTIFVMHRRGGILRYLGEVIPRLPDLGVDVSLFMGLYRSVSHLPNLRHRFSTFAGHRRPDLRRTHRAFLTLSNWWFRGFARPIRPDLYHPTDYTRLLPELRCKRVVTVHDLTQERCSQYFGGPNSAASRAKRAAVDAADSIVCISESTRRDLVELFDVRNKPIAVIPLASSLPAAGDSRRPLDAPYLLYVGARGGYKDFLCLLKAYAASEQLHRNFRLVLCGGEAWSTEEHALANSLRVTDRIHRDRPDDLGLSKYYRHATALVYPSRYEGFGLPVLESMQNGCPAVLSRSSSLPEVGGDAAVYFEPGSVEDLRSVLEHVVQEQGLREQMRVAGLARAAQFSWDRCAAETAAVYRSLLG